jgi:two-component system chemotaxis response regulator CheB
MTARRVINATCPECRGPLTEIQEEEIVEYECLVGHRYTPQSLLHTHAQAQERALWAAVVALEEAGNLVSAVGPHLPPTVRFSLKSEADGKGSQAAKIREIVHELTPFRTE